MNGRGKLICGVVALALLLFGSGCSSVRMKGTPFYTGENAKAKGPAEQRVNFWPLLYYHDPTLSVLWPIFEMADDHLAVRPLFSVYGLEQSNRIYNVLWPVAQFDQRHGNNRILPVFWGTNHLTLFPLYWHSGQPWDTAGSGYDSLFPLWIVNRKGTNSFSLYAPWPLVHLWSSTNLHTSGSMVVPLYWNQSNDAGSRFFSLPWWSGSETNGDYWRLLPALYYEASNKTQRVLVTPLWAQGHSQGKDWYAVIPFCYWDRQQHALISPLWARWQTGERETYFAPWALTGLMRRPAREDLWLVGGLVHAIWGPEAGAHHVLPLYYRDASHHMLLTPLCGWRDDAEGYFYPFTPLAGVRKGEETGSWVFPLYSYARDKARGNLSERFLVLGGYTEKPGHSHAWFCPLFSLWDDGPLESIPQSDATPGVYGKKFWCLPFCWYENRCRVRSAGTPGQGNPPPVREYRRKSGAFPLWSYAADATPAQYKSRVKGSAGVVLYDYKHEIGPGKGLKSGATNDYTHARLLWRLWHYERRNGDVSVDVFPGFTHDSKPDGWQKTSFLWRFYRYERAADGKKKLDVLFVPLVR